MCTQARKHTNITKLIDTFHKKMHTQCTEQKFCLFVQANIFSISNNNTWNMLQIYVHKPENIPILRNSLIHFTKRDIHEPQNIISVFSSKLTFFLVRSFLEKTDTSRPTKIDSLETQAESKPIQPHKQTLNRPDPKGHNHPSNLRDCCTP